MASTQPNHLLYFGGQTLTLGPSFRRLFTKAAESSLLRQFFDQGADALRLEASRARADEQRAVPVFRSINELAEKCNDDAIGKDVVLCTIALYIVQLGDYIW